MAKLRRVLRVALCHKRKKASDLLLCFRMCSGRVFSIGACLCCIVFIREEGTKKISVFLRLEVYFVGLMVKCTPERGQKCSLFHLMVKCTPIIVELPSVYRGCKPLICFQ